jgi:hypothetical protein
MTDQLTSDCNLERPTVIGSGDLLDSLRQKHRSANRFDVVCAKPHCDSRTVASRLPYDRANEIAERLQKKHNTRNPKRTSWTRRLYWACLSNRLI